MSKNIVFDVGTAAMIVSNTFMDEVNAPFE